MDDFLRGLVAMNASPDVPWLAVVECVAGIKCLRYKNETKNSYVNVSEVYLS